MTRKRSFDVASELCYTVASFAYAIMMTFDSASPFRKYPWLYGLVAVLSIGIVFLLLIGAWYAWRHHAETVNSPEGRPTVNYQQDADRMTILNILNTFHKDELAVPQKDPVKKKQAAHREHVEGVIGKLEAAKVNNEEKDAQGELLSVFKRWDDTLQHASSTASLKPDFVDIAAKYQWLNALVWIIILNRL